MRIKSTKFLFLFCCLFAFIFSDTIQEYDIGDSFESNEIWGTQIFKLNFNQLNSRYLHIKVESQSDINQLILISDDAEGNNRKSLGLQPYKPINLIVLQNEINNRVLYLSIKCLDNASSCSYKFTIKQEQSYELELGEQTNFFSRSNNKMSFTFKSPDLEGFATESNGDGVETNTNANQIKKLRKLNTVSNGNIWVKGQNIKNPTLKADDGTRINAQSFDYGYIFLIKEVSSNTFTLEFDSVQDDYITVGSLNLDEKENKYESTSELQLNDLETMGYLNQDLTEICFPFKELPGVDSGFIQVNGIVYTKKAQIYYMMDNEISYEADIKKGLINLRFYMTNSKKTKFCVKYPDFELKKSEVIFTFQLNSNTLNHYSKFIYPPQLPGVIYSHFLFAGQYAIFRGMKPQNNANEINFNMKAIKGFPNMLFDTPSDFPYTNYDDNNKLNDCIDPQPSNRMTVYSTYIKDPSYVPFDPLSQNQPLIIVQCKKESNAESVCFFETSIFTDKDKMNLIEDETFSQYLLEGESDSYNINIANEKNIEKVYLDLIVFSGDVNFEILTNNVDAHKYYLSNKLFYSIHVNSNNDNIEFKVTALKNSFYVVMYSLVKPGDDSRNTNKLESGVNFIQSVNAGDDEQMEKIIEIENLKYEQKYPFLVNFYSQNCQFEISRNKVELIDEEQMDFKETFEVLPFYGSSNQIIIEEKDDSYYHENFKFKLSIIGDDPSRYNKKLCMIYVTGLELYKPSNNLERTISVSEGIPQYYTFSKQYPYMKYTYFVSDINYQLIISFNLIDKGTFNIKVKHYDETIIQKDIYRREQILIDNQQLSKSCGVNDEVCPIEVSIELKTTDMDRNLETTIYQVNGAPVYLEKNVVKQDILLGPVKKYYYLDIGKNEEGNIIVDYIRGSGYIYAKVVNKMTPDHEINPDWRGMYEFPKTKEGTLIYETYFKKIHILKSDTSDCDDGCYVLITIQNADFDETDTRLTPYRVTITPRIFPEKYESDPTIIPKVKIPINQYILGDVRYTNKYLIFYELNLPYDSDYVIFDWQADNPSFFIDVEGENLDNEKHDFDFDSFGHDTVVRIRKDDILAKALEKGKQTNVIKNLNLKIGIWTKETDSIYSSSYAFKIFMPPNKGDEHEYDRSLVEIIHIRSDQKVQCDPNPQNGFYSCIFAVVFDEGDVGKNIIVYPRSQHENLQVSFAGYLVDGKEVEKNNLNFINSVFLTYKKDYESENGNKYIFYENIDRAKCILLSVRVEQKTIIEVLSSIYRYSDEKVIIPNPSTAQIFAIGDKKVLFNFETSMDLLINIVCISGDGNFYWEKEEEKEIKFYLEGFEDRLSLTSGTYDPNKILSKLVASSNSLTIFEPDVSGFVFYMTFYPRNPLHNFDQLKVGRSTEFNYRDVKFPLNFYSRLTTDRDISVSFTFLNYFMNQTTTEYDSTMITIWGKVISERQALDARLVPELRPTMENSISGSFDGAFGSLYLTFDEISSFNIDDNDKPYLFFSVERKENPDSLPFNGISLEVSLLYGNDLDYFVPEDIYINGKLSNKEQINNPYFIYKLKTDILEKPVMRIEFSANSDFVKWDVFSDIQLQNKVDGERKYLNGRYILTFQIPKNNDNYLYLKIYNDDKTRIDPKLCNYVFKYTNGKSVYSFFEFPQESDVLNFDIKMVNGKKHYDISFVPISLFKVNYYIKAIFADTKILEEKENTIAISESEGYYLQIDDAVADEGGKSHLLFEIPNEEREIDYIKVLAKVNYKTVKEFLLYKPIYIDLDDILPTVDYEEARPNVNLIERNYDKSTKQVKLSFAEAYKLQQYRINFNNKNDIPNYVKVEIESKDLTKQIMSFSPTDPLGKENRLQLGQSANGKKVSMWIKKEQFANNYLYTTVECQVEDEEKCDYNIQFVGYKHIKIESSVFTYNYYVSENNKVMDFSINNDLAISETSDQILTIYANGGKKIKLTLKNCIGETCEQHEFRTGAAITTTIQKDKYFELTVEAEEGDFISLGSKVTTSKGVSIDNVLKPNGYPFTGYLKKGVLNKECYSIYNIGIFSKISYIVGIFYNKVAEISFKDEFFNDLNKKDIVTNGYYSFIYDYNNDESLKYICIGFPSSGKYNVEDIPYSLQLTEPMDENNVLNVYTPQLRGNIYPRIISRGSTVFFNGANLNTDSDEIIYNMITTEGLPKMYIYKCTNYPLCKFNLTKEEYVNVDDDDNNKPFEIHEINRMSSWHNKNTVLNKNSPIDAEQYIMIVKCEDLENSVTDFCKFQTSIYGDRDDIYLIESQSFSQIILKDQKSKFIIDLSLENDITKVHIDTFIVNGEVNFELRDENLREIKANKYYLSNKIYYSVHIEENRGISRINVYTEAKKNSYFIIEYKLVKGATNEFDNEVFTGINYLIPIKPTVGSDKKDININNIKYLANEFYFASFYSLNCKLKITKVVNGVDEPISSFVNYAQDIIYKEDGETVDKHNYQVTVLESDPSVFDNNMCMVYVTGLEISQKEDSIIQKEILMSDQIPQKTVFQNNLSKMKYIYPNPDMQKSISLFVKVINPANYSCIISYNHKEEQIVEFYQTSIFYIDNFLMSGNCEDNELCNIIVTINVLNRIEDFVPSIEVTFKQNNLVPYYIPKGIVKEEFIPANTFLYMYTVVSKGDEGYINVDFARGSGLIYVKVVQFDEKGDSNPDWRQFKFPESQDESLYYEFYNKKIVFSKDDTSKCGNGCYLLISIQSSVKGKLDEEYRYHKFTITVSLTGKGLLQDTGDIIQIQPEQYVVGALSNEPKIENKDMYEFYQISIPYDADLIEFDWQSDSATLLINVGDKRPTINNHDFIKQFRSDSIFTLSNSQIIEKLPIAGNSITNVLLTIGVYTEDYESIYGSAYSFRVHFSKNNINIHNVYSDQKTQCKPTSIENNQYECLFMIIYEGLDFIYDLLIYSKSQNPSALTYMYGQFIDKNMYDSFNANLLKENKPNEKSPYNTQSEKVDFIFLSLSELDKHLYIKVVSDKPDVIEFITSFKTFDTEMSPNPSSLQLFALNNFPSMKLKFITKKPLLINVVSLYGSSKIVLNEENNLEYDLRGRDDQLSLAIPVNDKVTTLNIRDIKYKEDEDTGKEEEESEEQEIKMVKPGVAFYMEYFIRSPGLNFDEMYLGKTDEYIYVQSDFPLYYYGKLDDLNKDINVFFMLHDVAFKEGNEIKGSELLFKGGIIDQKSVYLIKSNKESKPNDLAIKGVYDPVLEVGRILFSTEDLKKHQFSKPTMYLSLEKNKTYFSLDNLRVELSAIQENNDYPVTEKLYQYGKVKDKNTINYYRLKVDNTNGYMRIQFSRNSEYVKYAISDEKNVKTNSSYQELTTKEERGKIFITFKKPEKDYIYLNVFLSDDAPSDDNRLNNYAFKYINSYEKSLFFEYPILNGNPKINPTFSRNKLNVKFYRINNSTNVNIIYTLKIAKQWKLSSKENNCTIAISETDCLIKKKENDYNDTITIEIDNIGRNNSYIQVVAQIKDGPIIEYVAYEPYYNITNIGPTPPPPPKSDTPTSDTPNPDKKSDTTPPPPQTNNDKTVIWVIIGLGAGIFVILVILIVIVLIYNSKTKNLMEQVNKISFVQQDKKGNDENLLLDDDNELK